MSWLTAWKRRQHHHRHAATRLAKLLSLAEVQGNSKSLCCFCRFRVHSWAVLCFKWLGGPFQQPLKVKPPQFTAMANQLLTNRTALVTGASRGIGRAVALELAAAGAEVVVNYARSPEAAAEVVTTIKEQGGRAYGVQADVSKETEADNLVKAALERSGSLDVLVNNAGMTRDGLLMRMKTADWQAVIDLNLSGVFYCTRAVTRPMLRQKRGRIVNITSVVGLMGNPGQANYGAAKAGVIGLTRTSAKELASRGITVNAVAPGFIATDMTSGLESDALLKAIPMGCFGQPEHVAGAVRFLAADPAAAYITGQVLQVDGGIY